MFARTLANNPNVAPASAVPRWKRWGFTLVELLVTMTIISILASLVLVAMFGAQEDAKIARTETQIAKIHELLMMKWEEYESRPVPMKLAPGTTPIQAAQLRLAALRELQRMEFPQIKADVLNNPTTPITRPSLSSAYLRKANAASGWTATPHGRAECLYLIISHMQDGNRKAIEFFSEDEIGDVDGDGMPEILDAWGRPLEFFRWAPGFIDPYSTLQFGDQNPTVAGDSSPPPRKDSSGNDIFMDPLGASSYDPFDPFRVDPRWHDIEKANDPFPLYPLVISAGPDGDFGNFEVNDDIGDQNDPFGVGSGGEFTGRVLDPDSIVDNIHNHFLIVR